MSHGGEVTHDGSGWERVLTRDRRGDPIDRVDQFTPAASYRMKLHRFPGRAAAPAIVPPLHQPTAQKLRVQAQDLTNSRKGEEITGCFAEKPFFSFTEEKLTAARFRKSAFLICLYGFRQNGEKESLFWHREIIAPVIFEIENIREKIHPERENACAAVGVDVGRHRRCTRKSQAKPISFVMSNPYQVSGAKLRAPIIGLCVQCTISEGVARRNVKIITRDGVSERLKKWPHSGPGA